MNDDKNNKPKYSYEELREKYIEKKEERNFPLREFSKDYSIIINFFVTVLVSIGLGLFLGLLLDNKLNTKPLFIILFTLLGIAASFRNLLKDINSRK